MGKPVSDHFLEKALPIVENGSDAPVSLDGRVITLIDEKCSGAGFRASKAGRAIRRLSDMPPAILAAAAVLILFLTPFLVLRAAVARPLGLAVRSVENASGGAETELELGTVLKGGRVLRTGEKGHLTMTNGNALVLHLFEKSQMRIIDEKKLFGIRLEKGGLYLARSRPLPGREPRIFIFEHSIHLMGTILYAEFLDTKSYRVMCREGLLEVRSSNAVSASLARIEGGNYADIASDGRILAAGRIESLPIGYTRMFEVLEPLSLDDQPEIDALLAALPYRIEKGSFPAASPRLVSENDPKKRIFAINEIGRLDSYHPETPQRTLGRSFTLHGERFLLLYDGVYAIRKAGLEKRLSFTRIPAAIPVAFTDGFLLFYQDGLVRYSNEFRSIQEIAYPKKGSLQNNYLPEMVGDSVLVPLQGAGLYRYHPENQNFETLDVSVFPASPILFEDGYLSATFYRNAYTRFGADGSKLWEYKLPGRSYVNPVVIGKEIFLYDEDDSGQKIIVLDASGKEIRAVRLPESLISDMAVSGNMIFVVSTKGNLFRVDCLTGKTTAIKRLYGEAMTSAQWRNASLTIDSGRLATLTSKGELELFGLPAMESLLKAQLPADSPFDLQPAVIGKRFYALNRSGGLFALDWLE
jgi:hypothetical protein